MPRVRPLVLLLDLTGTFVFAIEGAATAMHNGLDLLGILVLAFVTALGGGIIRDVLLSDTPPAAIRAWLYPSVALAGGAAALLATIPPTVLTTLDAAGLSLFAITGAQKAQDRGLPALTAVCLGAITATGGGTIRDVLLAHVPAVLRTDVYATAALAGAAVMVLAGKARLPPPAAALTGGVACFGWNLPHF
jgi:uncharacterized membrane protein YeiH